MSEEPDFTPETPPPAPEEANPSLPPKPDLKFSHQRSTVEVYNLDTIHSEQSGKIYDRSDFSGVIQRVFLEEEKLHLDSGAAQALTLTIELDKFREGKAASHDPLVRRIKPYIDEGEVKNTRFNNVKYITMPDGLRMLVWYDVERDRVVLTNNESLNAEGSQEVGVNVEPRPLDGINADEQLKNFWIASISLIDSINVIDLNRTYKVGENIGPLSVNKGLGRTAMGKPRDLDKPKTGDKPPSSDVLEQLSDILEPDDGRVDLTDIGGLEDVKSELRDIALSFKNQEVMDRWGAERPQGVLFYGPPGTGKTMLAEALATEIGADMLKIQSSDIYRSLLGDSEAKIKELFNAFRGLTKPTVVLFDEFDAIFGITEEPSPGGADNARNSVAGILKQELNSLAKTNPNVLIVATTNNLDRIDGSLVRSGRFDHKIYIPMPDLEGRTHITSNLVTGLIARQGEGESPLIGSNIDVPRIAELTDGLSGADIVEVFRRISLAKAMHEARTGHAEAITQEDIENELQDFKVENI